jgi:hypothetical protein
MNFYVADYLSSPLRGRLALEGDDTTRMVYLELLLKLWEQGGEMHRDEVPGALLVPQAKAEASLSKLIASGRIEVKDGIISNPRVTRDLQRVQEFAERQRESGQRGGLAKAKRTLSTRQRLAKASLSPPLPLPLPLPMPKPTPLPTPEPSPTPTPQRPRTAGAETAERLTAILNAVSGRRLSRNKAVEDLSDKAIAAGYPPDEQLGALWGGLCGKDEWWRSETGGDCDLTLLLRYKGGLNTTTGKEAKRWLADLQKFFPGELFPAWIREGCEKLRAAGLDAEVDWLKAHNARGAS